MSDIHVMDQIESIASTVMAGLKDFQKATVDRVIQLYQNGQKRVLVSDEVGLGKTLVARGTIAQLAKLRKEEDDNLVRVVYICSNAAIAQQNLDKLRIARDVKTEGVGSSRLSMQHLSIFNQEYDEDYLSRYIQLIPLTPDTSFRMTNGAGTYVERALMYAILRRLPELSRYKKALEVAMQDSAVSGWGWARDNYEYEVVMCDRRSGKKYLPYMLEKLSIEMGKDAEPGKTYLDLVIEMCQSIRKNGYKRQNNNVIIGKLRVIFAKISLDKLEPDLVIMDEFQRFKYLLNADKETETGMLADKFFYSDTVRMLLLSATPYKMYATLEEIEETNEDEHFLEFFDVMNFLNITPKEKAEFKEVWSNYSVHIKELTDGDTTILSAKQAAEDAMYQHVCRTERGSAFESADLINDSAVKQKLEATGQDIQSYIEAYKLLEEIGASFTPPVEYIKSTPYIMSFMRDYKLKRYIEKYFKEHPEEVKKMNKASFWVNRNTLNNYGKLPCANARLERVMEHTLKDNAELLLWVPASKPYYEPQGVFQKAENFSKTLIFSSWEMVPRMLASMLSYEAERKTVGTLVKANEDIKTHYFNNEGERRYPSARLRFSVNKGTPNSMALFCLLYPSDFLTKCYEPIACMNRGARLEEIEQEIKMKISEKLAKYDTPEKGTPDRRWYYMAPLFLDPCGYVTGWYDKDDKLLPSDDEEDNGKNQKAFLRHLQELRMLYRECDCGRRCTLGKKPDDLLDVLTDMALGSPAIVINRMYHTYSKGGFDSALPSQIAKIFINRMNTAEATATIELACGKKSEDAHWQNLLTYCKNGNLQAMFDEYAHIISSGMDVDENFITNLHKTIVDSMDIGTTIYNIDTYAGFKARMQGEKEVRTPMRSHFAVAFTKGDGKEKDTDRKKRLRNAFNSPFRPFVLASTSIGQEGLDFHNYCRRIVHWNLPSNPIDLEQREGRINRFECLAIRQNVAKRYGNDTFKKDVWKEMFETAAKKENDGKGSDLIPYWGLTESEDMVKIERIVPMYPFSRDELTYERLIKILSLYRLTLGQARQEELLEYIFQNCEDLEDMKKLFMNLSPYYKN